MRYLGISITSIVVFCVRGLLLWLVIPGAAVTWLVCFLPLIVWRIFTKRGPRLDLLFWVLWAIQLLDASISKIVFWDDNMQVPWPWAEPPTRGDEHVLLDAW